MLKTGSGFFAEVVFPWGGHLMGPPSPLPSQTHAGERCWGTCGVRRSHSPSCVMQPTQNNLLKTTLALLVGPAPCPLVLPSAAMSTHMHPRYTHPHTFIRPTNPTNTRVCKLTCNLLPPHAYVYSHMDWYT